MTTEYKMSALDGCSLNSRLSIAIGKRAKLNTPRCTEGGGCTSRDARNGGNVKILHQNEFGKGVGLMGLFSILFFALVAVSQRSGKDVDK